MGRPWTFRLLFILYCLEAGLFLVFAPWVPVWDRQMIQIPLGDLRAALLHPLFRGGVTGFGVLHLLWAVHDFDLWLRGLRP